MASSEPRRLRPKGRNAPVPGLPRVGIPLSCWPLTPADNREPHVPDQERLGIAVCVSLIIPDPSGCDSKPEAMFSSLAAAPSPVPCLGYKLLRLFFRLFFVYLSPEQFPFGLGRFFFWKSAL